MALNAGTSALEAGSLAAAIYSALDSLDAESETFQEDFAAALAGAVIDHITNNADVRITTSDAGLQQEVNQLGATVDTQAPSADVVLSSAIE